MTNAQDTIKNKLADMKASTDSEKVVGTPVVQTTSPAAMVTSPEVAPKVAPKAVEKKYHVFHNNVQSSKMVTDKGRTISFVGGQFVTDVEEDIEYLQREIALGNTFLYVKAGKEVMTSAELDPMKALRKQHLEEFAALQKEAARKIAAGEALSESESEVQKLVPGSTATVGLLSAGSDSVA